MVFLRTILQCKPARLVRRIALRPALFIAGICVGSAVLVCVLQRRIDEEVVGTVNGEPVLKKEFLFHLPAARSETYAYFRNRYGASGTNGFWTARFGKEIPIEYCAEKTWKRLVGIKVQQLLARRFGIIGDISYGYFRKRLEDENLRRREASREGCIFYGPQQLGEREYFNHTFNLLTLKLKKALCNGVLAPTTAELEFYYDSCKSVVYRNRDSIVVEVFSVAYTNGGAGGQKIPDKLQAFRILDTLRAFLEKGEQWNDMRDRYTLHDGLCYRTRLFSENRIAFDRRIDHVLYEAAQALDSGEICSAVDIYSEMVVMRCARRSLGGTKPFAEVEADVRCRYCDERYKTYLDSCMLFAKTRFNERALRSVSP